MKDVFTTRNINSDLNRDFIGGIIIYRGLIVTLIEICYSRLVNFKINIWKWFFKIGTCLEQQTSQPLELKVACFCFCFCYFLERVFKKFSRASLSFLIISISKCKEWGKQWPPAYKYFPHETVMWIQFCLIYLQNNFIKD